MKTSEAKPLGATQQTLLWVERLTLTNFRNYQNAALQVGPEPQVLIGANGAGKTNLLEALYFACTGRSCRTANEREVVRFGTGVTRLQLTAEDRRDATR